MKQTEMNTICGFNHVEPNANIDTWHGNGNTIVVNRRSLRQIPKEGGHSFEFIPRETYLNILDLINWQITVRPGI